LLLEPLKKKKRSERMCGKLSTFSVMSATMFLALTGIVILRQRAADLVEKKLGGVRGVGRDADQKSRGDLKERKRRKGV
jgi:hypothetical protein